MNTQSLILAILNFQDATGYEIKKQSTDGPFSYFVDISYGSIYPTLSRLEAEGLVTCVSQAQEGKPDKKVYSITAKGKSAFLDTLETPHQKDKFKSEFLLVAMCADLMTHDVLKRAIDAHVAEVEEIKSNIDSIGTDCTHPATQWIVDYGLHVKRAKLEYLEKNRDRLLALASSIDLIPEAAE